MMWDLPLLEEKKPGKRRKTRFLRIVIVVTATLLALVLLFDPFGSKQPAVSDVVSPIDSPLDTVSTDWVDEIPDTVAMVADTVTGPVLLDMDNAVVWVTNCTGVSGTAMNYRAGPAAGFSYVYTTTGTRRSTSVILCRRTDLHAGLESQPGWPLADTLAGTDTTLVPLPVDVSILLGTDLYYDGVNREYLLEPEAPAGTLYVDVANNGLQYTLGGMGAATWVASVLEGKSIMLDGTEWLLRVVDTRDGDRLSEELGIPELLETTLFLYRTDNGFFRLAEGKIRSAFQALPGDPVGPPEGLRVPDFWVLLGTPSGD
jgi:hypothetical protein